MASCEHVSFLISNRLETFKAYHDSQNVVTRKVYDKQKLYGLEKKHLKI